MHRIILEGVDCNAWTTIEYARRAELQVPGHRDFAGSILQPSLGCCLWGVLACILCKAKETDVAAITAGISLLCL